MRAWRRPRREAHHTTRAPRRRREIRGIGFVEFADARDAEDAQRGLDLMYLEGREVPTPASPLPLPPFLTTTTTHRQVTQDYQSSVTEEPRSHMSLDSNLEVQVLTYFRERENTNL